MCINTPALRGTDDDGYEHMEIRNAYRSRNLPEVCFCCLCVCFFFVDAPEKKKERGNYQQQSTLGDLVLTSLCSCVCLCEWALHNHVSESSSMLSLPVLKAVGDSLVHFAVCCWWWWWWRAENGIIVEATVHSAAAERRRGLVIRTSSPCMLSMYVEAG